MSLFIGGKTDARSHLMHYEVSKQDSLVSFLETKFICSRLQMAWDLCSSED